MNKKKIKEILEKNYYWFDEYKSEIDFGKYTPCGEDWYEHFDFKTTDSFIEDLDRRVDGFDIDEEVEVWVDMRGKDGVPEKITDLIEDAKWKLQELKDLLIGLIDTDIQIKVEQYGNAQKRYHGDNALSYRLESEIDSLSIRKKLLLKGV